MNYCFRILLDLVGYGSMEGKQPKEKERLPGNSDFE